MLEVALVIVVVLLIASLAGLVWLLMQRGVWMSRAAQAEAARDAALVAAKRAESDEHAATERANAMTAHLQRMQAEIYDLTSRASSLATEVEQLEARRKEDGAALARQHASEIKALTDRHQAELRGTLDLAAEKLAAAEAVNVKTREALTQAEGQFKTVFASLAGDALKNASGQFLQQAAATLQQQQAQIATKATGDIELKHQALTSLAEQMNKRLDATGQTLETLSLRFNQQASTISERLQFVNEASGKLREETGKLVKALREPQVRGRYGELQLRRVAELAGMRPYCDFAEQETTIDEHGDAKRPDMIVKLPNGRELVVDAKANLKPYIDAMEAASPEESETHLQRFADAVVDQARKLGGKAYYKEYRGSPDFVVMFVPGDQFMDAALSRRPDLLEKLMQHNVMLASPSTLIAMLRAVAVGFQEQRLSETAREMGEHVAVLRERLGKMLEHIQKVGERLGGAVNSYNDAMGSFDRRVRPQLEKIAEADGTLNDAKALPELKPLELQVRHSTNNLFAPALPRAEQE